MESLTVTAARALSGTGLLLLAASLAACSGPSARTDAGMLGYGTPGVASYVPADQLSSVQAMRDRCRQVPHADVASQTQGLPAACGQFERTLRNQPGNALQLVISR